MAATSTGTTIVLVRMKRCRSTLVRFCVDMIFLPSLRVRGKRDDATTSDRAAELWQTPSQLSARPRGTVYEQR
jgi:hypothetical protein